MNNELKGIKNIVLDMGGVVIDIDFKKTTDAFKNIGIPSFESLYSKAQQIGFLDDFEVGKISSDDFRNEIRSLLGKEISSEIIDTCWNSLILDFKVNRLDVVQQLSKNYKLYLLSNSNSIHHQELMRKIAVIIPFAEFSALFQQSYYSHLIQLRKPNTEIFEFTLAENKLLAEETLFVDDSLQHITSASKLGIKTYHITEGRDISDLL